MLFTPNRRSFIIASGMTALASTRVLGANDTLRIGVIGAGGRMRNLLDSAEKNNTLYQIVAVSDVYGPRRDEVKERSNGIATTHLDYHEVLAKDMMPCSSRPPIIGTCAWLRRTRWAKMFTWKNRLPTPLRKAPPLRKQSTPASRFCSVACSSAAGRIFAAPST